MTLISSKLELAQVLRVTPGEIDTVISRLSRFYRFRSEPKPNGGKRTFYIPHGKLRQIQDRIKNNILSHARFPAYVHGGIKGKSVFTNARSHSRKEAVLALDIKQFFPTIRPLRVLKVFERLGYSGEAARILTRLTTYEHQLPQGPSTSPAIANLCIPRADARLSGLARAQNLGHGRFVDDMTLSGSRRLGKFGRLAARIVEEEGFSVKQGRKGKLMLQSESQNVTGLGLNFKVNVTRKKREKILKDYVEILKTGLPIDDRTKGKLGWINLANPQVGKQLVKAARRASSHSTSG
jgi:retron-type reverse transcriptase